MKLFKNTFFKKIIILIFFFYFLIINLKKKYIYISKPKVSVFLPIYNKELYLKRSINSIQKQSLKNLEIIAVNDFSNDNSLKILKKLKKKDNRIKIINNDRNHGLLYTRAMGILNCTGEYVLNLDPDDMYSNIHNLKILYKTAKRKDTDVIIFELKTIEMNSILISKFNIILKDFNSNIKNFDSETIGQDTLITNKFMKREIILKAYESFKNMIYKNKWNYHEDNIWSDLILNNSISVILLKKIIYLYLLNKESLMKNLFNIVDIRNRIYRFQMENQISKNFDYYKFNNLLNITNIYKNILKNDVEIKKKLIHIIANFIIYCKTNNYPFLKNITNYISSIFSKK